MAHIRITSPTSAAAFALVDLLAEYGATAGPIKAEAGKSSSRSTGQSAARFPTRSPRRESGSTSAGSHRHPSRSTGTPIFCETPARASQRRSTRTLRSSGQANTEAFSSAEEARLLGRMEYVRSMLRDAKSLDVIETLLQVLADLEQRLAWVDTESVTSEPSST